MDSRPTRHLHSVHIHEDGNRIRNAILWTPHWLVRWYAIVRGINVGSAHQMLHCDLHYFPFKIQIMQKPSEWDKVCYIQFWNQFLDLVWDNPGVVNALLMSDEAHFHLSGYVNKQTSHYWSPHDTHELHQHPLHRHCDAQYLLLALLVLTYLKMM